MIRYALALLLLVLPGPVRAETALPLHSLTLPPGYAIEVYARVPGARSLSPAAELDAVFVGSRGPVIHALVDGNKDGRAETIIKIKSDLNVANGIAWRAPYLYVAEQHRIVRFKGATLDAIAAAPAEVLYDDLPDDPWHGWRYAAFGPDGWLYVAVGVACNICDAPGLQGTIVRLNPDTPGLVDVVARGVRNSVGIGFHPETGDMFFTDNGADHMGDDSPPDEFNHAPRPGLHFGFPYFGGGTDRTPDFADSPLPAGLVPPVVKFGAHVASLGFAFHHGNAIVAHRGSWNRSTPDGYRLARVPFGPDGKAKGTWEPFVEGWLDPFTEQAWGRPVDVKQMGDGALLISDDRAGAVYRLHKTPSP